MQRLLIIICCSIFATTAFNQTCEPTVAYNFDGNSTDVSGNDNDAVLFSDATTALDYLEIGYNDDDRAEIPVTALNGVTDFTVTVEFYLNDLNLTGLAPTNTIIAGASSTNEGEFAISYQADIEAVVVALKGSGDVFPVSLAAETWYCLTVTREGSMVTVFIDGSEINTIDMTSSVLSIEFLEIGQELDCVSGCYATNQCLNGRLDNFSIYPCATKNSSCQPYIVDCDTTLFYQFNGNALDEGAFANHGTLNAEASVALNILEIGYNDDDYVEIPTNAADGLTDFAISFNFYLNALNESGSSPTNTFIAGTNGTDMHEFALSYEANSNAFEVAIHEIGGIIPATILPETWYCVTFYRKSDSVWIELDGVILPTTLIIPEGPLSLTLFEIGQEIDCPEGCFAENQSLNGKMDNLIIQSCAEQVVCGEVGVGIETNKNHVVTIFPNPTINLITIKIPVDFASAEITITNFLGQKITPIIISNYGNAIQLDMSNLNPGNYIIHLSHKESNITEIISVIN